MNYSEAGRKIEEIIRKVKWGQKFDPNKLICNCTKVFYVNKTPKYVSIKLEVDHLTKEQLDEASKQIQILYPSVFLKLYNSTANNGHYTYEKVLCRLKQV